jgi:UPF0755 protein
MLKRGFRIVVVLAVVAAAAGWWMHRRIQTPYRGFTGAEAFVELPPGTGVSGIGTRLANAGIVPDALTFRLAARLAGADRKLQAGEYRFAEEATPAAVIARLAAGDVYKRPLTFPEGLTIAEMGKLFESAGLGAASDFVSAAEDPVLRASVAPEARSLEGYLFPDTYPLSRHASAGEVVRAMLAGFDRAFDADLRAEAVRRGVPTHTVVTLASLVEKETAKAEERPMVAAVYYNRLKLHMALQCDPTVIYALMLAGRWDGNIRRVDLDMNSPYNTYRFPGLPPGPIASPGRAALEAAVRPADVPYLYFVSRNDGSHVFATTLAEHNRNVTMWQVKYFKKKAHSN